MALIYSDFSAEDTVYSTDGIFCKNQNAWYQNQYVLWRLDQTKFTEVTIALLYK